MHVDDEDEGRRALMEHAQVFFGGARTKNDVFMRVVHCFEAFKIQVTGMAERGVLTSEDAAAWSWFSVAMPAMMLLVFKGEPKWDTRELEVQLNEQFLKGLRRARAMGIKHPEEPGPEQPIALPGLGAPLDPTKPH